MTRFRRVSDWLNGLSGLWQGCILLALGGLILAAAWWWG
jgi:hypothetical protein